MKKALLKIYSDLSEAELKQFKKGKHDQGARAQVTSGKHLTEVEKVIRNDLIQAGYHPNDVYYEGGCLKIPGWFRPSKTWDLMAFDDQNLLAIVELKSINSSFGNNSNNRTEESLGSAIDAQYALKNNLIPFQTNPPFLGYVLIIKICEDSMRRTKDLSNTIYPIDPVYNGASYFERLTIMCRRLLAERLYQAVWIVGVDPATGEIVEPEKDLTYDKFLMALKSQLWIHKA